MKKLFVLVSGISFVILLVSSVFDIFFPLTVVGSVAQHVPTRGKIRLWYWLAGNSQPTTEIVQQQVEAYSFSYDQDEIDAWIIQYMGNNLQDDLIWVNNILFAPMDNPVITESPEYAFEWVPEIDPNDLTQFVCAPLVVGGTTYQTDFYGSDNGPNVWEHTGIDFGTYNQEGLPVITPIAGIVVYASANAGWGNTVIIQNGEYQVWLTHALEFNVEAGQTVEAGDVVLFSGGRPGTTGAGQSSGPHLHFEVRHCYQNNQGKNVCEIMNPNSTMLPGQEKICFWNAQVSAPEMNWTPFVLPK